MVMSINNNAFTYSLTSSTEPGGTEPSSMESSSIESKNLTLDIDFLSYYFNDDG